MNELSWNAPRKRSRTLLIVEGYHEKNILFNKIISAFPEMNIKEDDIFVYKSNIYNLVTKIVNEYGEDWKDLDIDLPWLITKDSKDETLRKRNFKNIFLIFDYERHDPLYSEKTINSILEYFSKVEDVGKLYINYPMVESYLDLNGFPDDGYENRKFSASIKNGKKYKNTITKRFAYKLINFPKKISEILTKRFHTATDVSEVFVERLLQISSMDEVDKLICDVLKGNLIDENLKTFECQLKVLIKEMTFMESKKSYNEFMRYAYKQIIVHNIKKANKIQNDVYDVKNDDLLDCYNGLNDQKILDKQNRISVFTCEGDVWVLNTSVFIVPDYNLSLIFNSKSKKSST